jgi:predicted amidophosphoribosyltransferase
MNQSTAPCPHCGAEIQLNAKFCRHCGSSESDGWRDEFDDYEDDEFDYDEYVAEEFSTSAANQQTRPMWRFVSVVLLILFVFGYLFFLL